MSGNKKIAILMGSAAFLGAMTPMERQKGRYMRAPDHPAGDGGGSGDAEFDAFEKAGNVEVGKDGIETNLPEEKPEEKPAAKPKSGASGKAPREKPAAAGAKPDDGAAGKAKGEGKPGEGEDGGEAKPEDGEGEGDEDEEEEEEKPEKKPKKASERIRELNARLRASERLRIADQQRLDALEKRVLQGGGDGGNGRDTGKAAPDPTDTAKYPLGHLDDRYIEDKLEWLAEEKAAARADAVLQRQQEGEQARDAEKAREALLEKVDDLSTRGSEQFDDFQEAVVEAGMRGDWRLEQPTFEAAHEAENGAQILYELSQDKKEAARVASLSPYQQMRFVMDRDAEISSKAKPRTKPKAGEPPATQTRGANSSTRINPATDNLDSFEKAWLADEKG
jgi:hypothetical protein